MRSGFVNYSQKERPQRQGRMLGAAVSYAGALSDRLKNPCTKWLDFDAGLGKLGLLASVPCLAPQAN
jgi:hypothetical protein